MKFGIVAGYVFDESGETLTLAEVNQMFTNGYGVSIAGTLEINDIPDGLITAAKLATTLDLSSKTITYSGPTWDSGWTYITVDTVYDLTATSGENFSSTSKSSQGATSASGTLAITPDANSPGYAFAQVLFKKYDAGSTYNDYLMVAETFYNNDGTSAQGFTVFNDNGTLKLKTAQNHVFTFDQVDSFDWGDTGDTDYTNGLLRIKLWES